MSSRAGYVLVGGKSSRMGRDKAGLRVRDRTMVEVVAGAVAAAAGSATLVGGSGLGRPAQFGFVPDRYPGEGPLGGILAALRHTASDWNLVVACDMPAVTADFLSRLLEAAELSGADALIPAGPSGHVEPLCAVYHRRSVGGVQRAFDRGVRKIATALEEVRAVTWNVPEASCFQNVNTPEEWAAYER